MVATPPEPPCSARVHAPDEPLAGTAATAATWLCLEQPGPWGRDALTQSHLDPGLGAELTARARDTGVRLALIRRPGRYADTNGPHRVYLAHTAPGRTFLRTELLTDHKHLLDLDLPRLGAGDHDGFGAATTDPLLLVCTNGRRDKCCAVRGRPIAQALAGRHGEHVWECTHIGGHRFAPTALLLPTGYAYGDIDTDLGETLLVGRDVVVDRCRGRSTWPPAAQAADLAVRHLTHTVHPDVLSVRAITRDDEGNHRVVLIHDDGRSWVVTVVERETGPDRPASCGAALTPPVGYVVHRID